MTRTTKQKVTKTMTKTTPVQVLEPLDRNEMGAVLVTEKNVDALVKSINNGLKLRNELPKSGLQTTHKSTVVELNEFLNKAVDDLVNIVTTGINGGQFTTDTYKVLAAQCSCFGKDDKVINKMISVRLEKLKAEANAAGDQFSPEELALIASEPIAEDVSTHTVEATTRSGTRVIIDKIKRTRTILVNGAKKIGTYTYDKTKSWYNAAKAWVIKIIGTIKYYIVFAVTYVLRQFHLAYLYVKENIPFIGTKAVEQKIPVEATNEKGEKVEAVLA